MTEARAFLDGGVDTEAAAKPRHRPGEYSPDLALIICDAIAEGMSMNQVAELPWIPSRTTIFNWLGKHQEFQSMYVAALKWRSAHRADEIIQIADDSTKDYVEVTEGEGVVVKVVDKEHILRTKLRIEARKWVISKEYPERYGEFKLAPPPAQILPPQDDEMRVVGSSRTEHALSRAVSAWRSNDVVPAG